MSKRSRAGARRRARWLQRTHAESARMTQTQQEPPAGGRRLRRALRWRPTRGEAHAILFVTAVKSVFALAMLLFAWNYLELARAFGLHAYFPDSYNFAAGAVITMNRWYTAADTSAWYLPLANWDGQHYLLLSDYGYNYGHDKTGGQQFFPLYPLLIRACSLLMPRPAAALLLNYFFMAGFALFIHRIAVAYRCRWPLLAALVMMAFPTAFFTATIYTEPLFLFLLAGFIWHFCHSGQRAYLLYFALLPLARGSAVFVLGGLALYALLHHARRRGMRIVAPPAAGADWRCYAHCAAAFAAGACAYLAFFYFATGDALAGLTAQRRYGHDYNIFYLFNPLHLWEVLSGGRHSDGWFGQTYPHLDYAALLLMLAGAAFIALKREWGLLCFYFPLLYSHATMSPLTSFSRYALTALPFLALAMAKYTRRHWQAALVLALCAAAFAAQLYLAARFSVNIWVS
ncbi:MAG: mannosyltransferase family protein [Gammaproteobacteria bacterium]